MTTEIYVVYVAVVVWLTRSRLSLAAASAQEVILAQMHPGTSRAA